MANHKSSLKRVRQTEKITARNRHRRSTIRTAVRTFRESLEGESKDLASAALVTASRLIRKGASKGIAHKATASRHVSRLALAFNKRFAG